MRYKILFGLLAVLAFTISCNLVSKKTDAELNNTAKSEAEKINPKGDKNLVLVELFTSEG